MNRNATDAIKPIVAALLFVAFGPLAAAPLTPSGKWVLEGEPSGCILSREFGVGPDKVTFGIKRLPLSNEIQVLFAGPQRLDRPIIESQGRILYSPGSWGGSIISRAAGGGVWITSAQIPAADLDVLTRAPTIEFHFGAIGEGQIADTGLAATRAALQNCEQRLIEDWKIDPVAQAAIATHATGDPVNFYSTDDYPKSALQRNIQGTAVILYRIGIDGRLLDCRVLHSSGNAALDAVSCSALMRNARFQPAIDKGGRPVIDYGTRIVRWQLTTRLVLRQPSSPKTR